MATSTAGTSFAMPIKGDDLTKYITSQQNYLSGFGQQAGGKGQTAYGSGLGALGPVLTSLNHLVNGNQADVTQAIQPEADRIKDSFAAVRNMISQQPRGGGKAGILAEAPYKEAQQINETATQMRQGATGQLGSLASTLAGLGLSETDLGLKASEAGSGAALKRREQNVQETAGLMNMIGQLGGAAGKMAAAYATGGASEAGD